MTVEIVIVLAYVVTAVILFATEKLSVGLMFWIMNKIMIPWYRPFYHWRHP